MKRLIKKSAVEIDNMTGPSPTIVQKGPEGYKDFEDFVNNATQEEIDQYMNDMYEKTVEKEKVDNFKDEMYW